MRPVGFRSQTIQRPLVIEDRERRLNEMAVLQTFPRKVVLILSFSNPQARIVEDGYRFMWFEGEAQYEAFQQGLGKVTHQKHTILNPKYKFPALISLADTDGKIDEAVLVLGQDQQIANWSFKDRYIALLRPDYHLEWTEGVRVADAIGGGDQNLILGPEALG